MIAAALMSSLLALGPQADVAEADATRLGLVSGNAATSLWTSEPVEIAPEVWRVWWWQIFHPPSEFDGMSRAAFLHEVHCATNQLRQVRFELYADERLLSGSDQDQPLHTPVDRWADPQVMARVCGPDQPRVVVADAAQAAAHFRR